MKEQKFEKVVEYYYPNGEEFNDGAFAFYVSHIFLGLIVWVFFPLFLLFDNNCWIRGSRKVYWRKIK